MANVKDLTVDELELLIKQKILEILGDPDSGSELKEEFKAELRQRLTGQPKKISHEEVLERFG